MARLLGMTVTTASVLLMVSSAMATATTNTQTQAAQTVAQINNTRPPSALDKKPRNNALTAYNGHQWRSQRYNKRYYRNQREYRQHRALQRAKIRAQRRVDYYPSNRYYYPKYYLGPYYPPYYYNYYYSRYTYPVYSSPYYAYPPGLRNWRWARGNRVPINAVSYTYSHNGHSVYTCRVYYKKRGYVYGRLVQGHGCHIRYNGKRIKVNRYQVNVW